MYKRRKIYSYLQAKFYNIKLDIENKYLIYAKNM